MTTTPGPSENDDLAEQRWTGRASVGTPESSRAVGAAAVGSQQDWIPATVAEPVSPALPPTYGAKPKLRPRWGRIALVTLIALALVAGGMLTWGLLYIKHVNDNLKRTESIDEMVAGSNRPPKTVSGALNILLLGSDSRDPDQPVTEGGNWRTDTIELMHVPASHDKAYFISFPRDLWVHVPKSRTSSYGDTMAKINAASAWGGVPLVAQTVEEYTGVRIDHLALIDFAGFVKVVDAIGGVDMNIERTIRSIHPPYRTFHKGLNHLSGAEALDYVRQRKQFPDGDFARIRHQQQFLKAVMDKGVSAGTITDLGRLTAFVSSVADAVTVDKDFSVLDVVWQFHGLRSNDLTFMTTPNAGTATEDGQSVVLSDRTKALALFDAVNKDTVARWLAQPGNSP